jgi:hypothetical protein
MTKSSHLVPYEVEKQTEKYSKIIHLVNKSNNEKRLRSKQGWQDGLWWWSQWWIGLQNQRSNKVHMEKSRSKTNKDGKGSGLFAMEDIEKMNMS